MSSPSPVPPPALQQKASPAKGKPTKGRFGFSKVLARWWWLATVFVAMITYVVSKTPTWMGMAGPLHESVALVEVKPIVDVDSWNPAKSGVDEFGSRRFIKTQFEIISATSTLEAALAKKDLLSRLGGSRDEAVARMQKSIRTNQRRGTDLVEIGYRDEDAELAYDGAVAVYEAYKERREILEMDRRKEQLKAIKIELQNKSDRVAELKKRLMDVAARSEGLHFDFVVEESEIQQFPEADRRKITEKELFEAEWEVRKLTLTLNKLLAAKDDELIELATELPDIGFAQIYQKYKEAKRELETMKASGLAEGHPDIKFRRLRINELKKSLLKRAQDSRKSLKLQLGMATKRVEKLRKGLNKIQDEDRHKASSIQELNVARKEYEIARGIRDGMETRYDLERTKMVMPMNNIIVHERPERSSRTVTKGRDFYAALGTVCSLPFSIGLGILLMYIAEMIIPRRS